MWCAAPRPSRTRRPSPSVAFGSHVDTATLRAEAGTTTWARSRFTSEAARPCRNAFAIRHVEGGTSRRLPRCAAASGSSTQASTGNVTKTLEHLWNAGAARRSRPLPGDPTGRRCTISDRATTQAQSRCFAGACPPEGPASRLPRRARPRICAAWAVWLPRSNSARDRLDRRGRLPFPQISFRETACSAHPQWCQSLSGQFCRLRRQNCPGKVRFHVGGAAIADKRMRWRATECGSCAPRRIFVYPCPTPQRHSRIRDGRVRPSMRNALPPLTISLDRQPMV